MKHLLLILCLLGPIAPPARAAPDLYRLDTQRSLVGFSYRFGGAEKSGQMPVKSASMRIDLDDLTKSQVTVTLNARAARAGFIFATQAMKSAEVLNTAQFPEIRFNSTSFSGSLQGATVTGDLTIRGVTRPVTLKAGLYRQRGTDIGDRDNLTVLLIGSISRTAFGAGGFPGFVGDRIGLQIIARIQK